MEELEGYPPDWVHGTLHLHPPTLRMHGPPKLRLAIENVIQAKNIENIGLCKENSRLRAEAGSLRLACKAILRIRDEVGTYSDPNLPQVCKIIEDTFEGLYGEDYLQKGHNQRSGEEEG
jgi:hypothetical protein